MRFLFYSLFSILITQFILISCSNEIKGRCEPGTENCPCDDEGACGEGLVCSDEDKLCVLDEDTVESAESSDDDGDAEEETDSNDDDVDEDGEESDDDDTDEPETGEDDESENDGETGDDDESEDDADTEDDDDLDEDPDSDSETDDAVDTADDTGSDGSCQYDCVMGCSWQNGTEMSGECENPQQVCCDLDGSDDDDAVDTNEGSDDEIVTDTGGSDEETEDSESEEEEDTEIDTNADTEPHPDANVEIDLAVEHQHISGFGGMNCPTWISDLSADQANTAFGNDQGQLGLSILRIMVPPNSRDFEREVATAQRAVSHGATVFATPWSPPTSMKSNGGLVGGRLNSASYGAYADHLISFRDHMASNDVPLYAISVQNEPDIDVSYDSCYWSPQEMISWLTGQASKFGDTKLMVAESYNYNKTITDPILNDATAEPLFDIVGVHLYGAVGSDYPLAREKGKEIWMTEHYTDSSNDANLWPMALDVAREVHECMVANFSAYIWWYIRRSYGLISENGQVSKRGYMMAQFSKYVRPGFMRVDSATSGLMNMEITAYKKGNEVVIVAINAGGNPQNLTLHLQNGTVSSFSQITSSGSKDLSEEGSVSVTDNLMSVTLDGQSVSTFVSE